MKTMISEICKLIRSISLKKKFGIWTIILITPFLLDFGFHSTPKLAMRTNMFFKGHIKIAITSPIIEDQVDNNAFEKYLTQEKAKCYSFKNLSNPENKDFIIWRHGKMRYYANYLNNYIRIIKNV